VRAFVEHRPTTPWKVWYVAPSFRYEAPQAGRYRQHHQLGIEALGTDDPDLDVEVIALQSRFYESLGLRRVRLKLNSLGDAETRPRYLELLRAHFGAAGADLSAQSRETLAVNPLRVLDSKRPQDAEIIAAAPAMTDVLSAAAAAHFERVQSGLTSLGVAFDLEPRLVRGLDYYTRTTFEFVHDGLGAQSGIGGGGRYDGLMAELGGQELSGIGFGLGVDRTFLACQVEGLTPGPSRALDAYVVPLGEARTRAAVLATELRRAGIRTDLAYGGRGLKGAMKGADRSGAAFAIVIGERDLEAGVAQVKSMDTGEQTAIPLDLLSSHLTQQLKELHP
jgi:histidyl-tRNA synthetase